MVCLSRVEKSQASGKGGLWLVFCACLGIRRSVFWIGSCSMKISNLELVGRTIFIRGIIPSQFFRLYFFIGSVTWGRRSWDEDRPILNSRLPRLLVLLIQSLTVPQTPESTSLKMKKLLYLMPSCGNSRNWLHGTFDPCEDKTLPSSTRIWSERSCKKLVYRKKKVLGNMLGNLWFFLKDEMNDECGVWPRYQDLHGFALKRLVFEGWVRQSWVQHIGRNSALVPVVKGQKLLGVLSW